MIALLAVVAVCVTVIGVSWAHAWRDRNDYKIEIARIEKGAGDVR